MKKSPSQSFISCLKQLIYTKEAILYIFIFIFGLLVRLPVGVKFADVFASDYAAIAQNLVNGKGYSLSSGQPTAWRTPGYPLILAGIMALFGEQRTPLIILTSIVGALNAGLCAWLGIKVFRRSVGFIAGILYVVIPYLAQKEAATINGLVTLGLLIALCLLWKGWKNKSFVYIGFSGLGLAFSYLVSPGIGIIILFVSISLILGLSKDKNIRWRLAQAATLMLVFIIGISPWPIRNYNVFKRLYLGQTFFWYDVYTSNHTRTFQIYPYFSLDNFAFMVPLTNQPEHSNEFARESWFRQLALSEISKLKPKEIITRGCRKLLYLWSIRLIPYTDRVGNDPLRGRPLDTPRPLWKNLAFSLPYLFLLIFASIGCWQERKQRWLLYFSAGLLLSFSIPYLVTIGYSRYTTQIYFVLIILAARGLVYALQDTTVNVR